MNLKTTFLFALAGLVLPLYAQDFVSRFPECAANCSAQAALQLSCSYTDKSCLCKNPETLVNNVVGCAATLCLPPDLLISTNATLGYCDVPIRDESLTLEVITGLFTALSIIFIGLRMSTRFGSSKVAFGWDDALIVSTLLCAVGDAVLQYLSTERGFGRDIWTIPTDTVTELLKLFYATEFFYSYGTAGMKLSILAFYLRIFTTKSFRLATYIVMAVIIAFLVTCEFITIFQCTPISFAWKGWKGEMKGHCINIWALAWFTSPFNIVLDIVVMALPLPHLLRLNLSRKKKFQVASMFSVGLFVTITSVVRLHTLVKFRATQNFTHDYVETVYYSILEINVGIVCACMPAVQLLLRRIAPKWFGSTIDSSSYLHEQSTTRNRAFRNTGSHIPHQRSQITKTTVTTVVDQAKDSDSVIELVDNGKKDGEGASFATTSSGAVGRNQW